MKPCALESTSWLAAQLSAFGPSPIVPNRNLSLIAQAGGPAHVSARIHTTSAMAVGAVAAVVLSVVATVGLAAVPTAHAQAVPQYGLWDSANTPIAAPFGTFLIDRIVFGLWIYGDDNGQHPLYGSQPFSYVNSRLLPTFERAAWGDTMAAERSVIVDWPVATQRIDLLNNSVAVHYRPVNATWPDVVAYPYTVQIDEHETLTFVNGVSGSHYIVGGPNATAYVQGPGGSRGGVAWEVHVPGGGQASVPSDGLEPGHYWYECLTHGESGTFHVTE